LELGLGTGWAADDYHRTGLDMDAPGTRIARLTESVKVITR
jgi:alkanesulfonate monooxygenase SsuD/methylene tetrahydromethanopterin reductase-like flavin-dependent oxidoreductase (luciferase family)